MYDDTADPEGYFDYRDVMNDIKTEVEEDYFSSGIWFDEGSSYISGWFSDKEINSALEAGYFMHEGGKFMNFRIDTYAAGSKHADNKVSSFV
jgi:hypothetical protein